MAFWDSTLWWCNSVERSDTGSRRQVLQCGFQTNAREQAEEHAALHGHVLRNVHGHTIPEGASPHQDVREV